MLIMKEKFEIINSLKGIEYLRVSLERIAQSWSLSSKLLFELNLILEELCTNYIEHAAAESNSLLDVEMVLDGKIIEVTVKDSGKPFNPTEMSDPDINASIDKREPGGLGLYLVKRYSDSFDYSRVDGENVVTIKKNINPN